MKAKTSIKDIECSQYLVKISRDLKILKINKGEFPKAENPTHNEESRSVDGEASQPQMTLNLW